MSQRLVKEWVIGPGALEKVFGKNGKMGDIAEQVVKATLEKSGHTVTIFEDASHQRAGVDVEFNRNWKRPYTGQVKSTDSHNDQWTMPLRQEWLSATTDRVFFYNHKNPGWLYWFDVQEMIVHLENQPHKDVYKIPLGTDRPKLVYATHATVPVKQHDPFYDVLATPSPTVP